MFFTPFVFRMNFYFNGVQIQFFPTSPIRTLFSVNNRTIFCFKLFINLFIIYIFTMHFHDLYICYSRLSRKNQRFYFQPDFFGCPVYVVHICAMHAHAYSIAIVITWNASLILLQSALFICIFMWTRLWSRERVQKARSIPIEPSDRCCVWGKIGENKQFAFQVFSIEVKRRKKTTTKATTNTKMTKTRAKNGI